MYLLDTDILTLLFRQHPKIHERLQLVAAEDLVARSIITRIQILQGRFDTVMKAANQDEWLRAQVWLDDTEHRLAELTIIPINEAAADEFESLRLSKRTRKMERGDLLIACIALAHRATLVTRNVKDFKLVPGLKIENWAD